MHTFVLFKVKLMPLLDVFDERVNTITTGIAQPAKPVGPVCQSIRLSDKIYPLWLKQLKPQVLFAEWLFINMSTIPYPENSYQENEVRAFVLVPQSTQGAGGKVEYTIFVKNFENIIYNNIFVKVDFSQEINIYNIITRGANANDLFFVKNKTDNTILLFLKRIKPQQSLQATIIGLISLSVIGELKVTVTCLGSIYPPHSFVTIIDPSLGSDLRVFALSIVEATPGQQLLYQFVLRNDGLVMAWDVTCMVSLPIEFSVEGFTMEKDFMTAGVNQNNEIVFKGGVISPNEAFTFSISGSLASEIALGTELEARIVADHLGLIAEKDEGNNVALVKTKIV